MTKGCQSCGQSFAECDSTNCGNNDNDRERECSSCELPQSWFAEMRENKCPHVGCSSCGNGPFMWCTTCDKPHREIPPAYGGGEAVCDCWGNCPGCDEPVKAGSDTVDIKGKVWHLACGETE